MISLYFIIALIVASFALFHLLKKAGNGRYETTEDEVGGYAFLSILMGLFWFITIWVALIKLVVDDSTPYWAKPIQKVYKFWKSKCHK